MSTYGAKHHVVTNVKVCAYFLQRVRIARNAERYRKSHMGFQLVPKSVTLNDLERRNGRIVCVISPNSVALGRIT